MLTSRTTRDAPGFPTRTLPTTPRPSGLGPTETHTGTLRDQHIPTRLSARWSQVSVWKIQGFNGCYAWRRYGIGGPHFKLSSDELHGTRCTHWIHSSLDGRAKPFKSYHFYQPL